MIACYKLLRLTCKANAVASEKLLTLPPPTLSLNRLLSMEKGSVQTTIEKKLKDKFEPLYLEVLNESYKHSVPKGSESHFKPTPTAVINCGTSTCVCLPLQHEELVMLSMVSNRELSILSEWRGLRNEELCKVSGIADCVFVHSSGFIGGNKTYEGALEMARLSLQQT